MDFPAVIGVLNDVPDTFSRDGAPYTQFIDATTIALCRLTEGADATEAQVASYLTGPVDGWLDTWGLLFGIPRQQGEANNSYYIRISRTVLAWVGTFPAIVAWVNFFAPGGTVTENLPNVGYTITLPPNITANQIQTFLTGLNRIRPAGVPFSVFQTGLGTYLGTVDFTADGAIVGDYLASGTLQIALNIPAMTFNNSPLIPTLLMADPTINPSLQP